MLSKKLYNTYIICFFIIGIVSLLQSLEEMKYNERFRSGICMVISYICLTQANTYMKYIKNYNDKYRYRSFDRNK